MRVMVKRPKPGEWYAVNHVCGGYPLPDGLVPGENVTVCGHEAGYFRVKDKAGQAVMA